MTETRRVSAPSLARYRLSVDLLVDWILPQLGHAERAVLLYVIRRSSRSDGMPAITLDEFCLGRRTTEGRALDLGTGLSRPSVLRAIRSLEQLSYLLVTRGTTFGGRACTSRYWLNLPLLEAVALDLATEAQVPPPIDNDTEGME